MTSRSGLLVSVRSVAEAEAALAGGASLIDIKEPSRGPLGRADSATITAIVRHVAGRCPVSAALGEMAEFTSLEKNKGLTFVKLGLAGAANLDWQNILSGHLHNGLGPGHSPQLVVTAYADADNAGAPPVDEVCRFACLQPGNVFLLDTYKKEKRLTLLDWLPPQTVMAMCHRCREAGVRIALAGSLGPREIMELRVAQPDWFAVRGAVCTEGRREGAVCAEKVRELITID
jgi:uncharacterized protein (UPF0264 family)